MKDVYIKNKKDLLEFLEYERKLYNIKKKRPPIFV